MSNEPYVISNEMRNLVLKKLFEISLNGRNDIISTFGL